MVVVFEVENFVDHVGGNFFRRILTLAGFFIVSILVGFKPSLAFGHGQEQVSKSISPFFQKLIFHSFFRKATFI